MASSRQRMLKTIPSEPSMREMNQRDSVELCGDEGHQDPMCVPTRRAGTVRVGHGPSGTHVDAGGIEGALPGERGVGSVGEGAGCQQHPAPAAQRQPDGDGQPRQAGQRAQAAAGAQGQNRPFLREGRDEGERRDGATHGHPPGVVPKRGGCGMEPCGAAGSGLLTRAAGAK